MRAAGGQRDRRTIAILAPRTSRRVRLRSVRWVRWELERARDVDRDRLGFVAGIPKGKDAATGRPGGMAVHLELARIAAEPVRVRQHVPVGARPVRRLGERVPIVLREQRRRDVHLLELSAGAEIRANLALEVVGW